MIGIYFECQNCVSFVPIVNSISVQPSVYNYIKLEAIFHLLNGFVWKWYSICIIIHFYPRPPLAPTGIVVGHSVFPSVHSEWCSFSNSLRISAISLKFGGMMHSTMEQIAIYNGHVRPIYACSTELKFSMKGFFDQVWRKSYCSNSLRISAIGLKFGGMMDNNMKQIAI